MLHLYSGSVVRSAWLSDAVRANRSVILVRTDGDLVLMPESRVACDGNPVMRPFSSATGQPATGNYWIEWLDRSYAAMSVVAVLTNTRRVETVPASVTTGSRRA